MVGRKFSLAVSKAYVPELNQEENGAVMFDTINTAVHHSDRHGVVVEGDAGAERYYTILL